ncbi:MAG TPA: hypothetical protein VJO12_14100 [Stellaceae bacterium]|nr:hypothetical protein [Stellaceae bacterium]
MTFLELLIPSWADLAAWAGVLLTAALFIGVGRLLSLGRATPEAALVAGWGGACLALTLWGIVTAASLRWPAVAIVVAGLVGLVLPRFRLDVMAWRSVLRMMVVALPLLAVMASARPSLPDTFLNLLPNAAYLYNHASFPADLRWPAHSFLPAAPYNMQLAAFVASLFTPGFPATAMIAINLVLQLAVALFLARLVERGDDAAAILPSWGATALGLLLATLINPGFVPRFHFSAYSETSVTVALAFAAWFAARALDRLAARRAARAELTLFALTLAALVNIKQDSIALVAGLLASVLVLALLQGREGRGRSLAALLLAAAPAILLYAAWRWYVLDHFAEGELKPLPFAQWQFANLPLILRSMLKEILEKGYFFALAALAIGGLVWRMRRRGLDTTTRVAALFTGVLLVYNVALVVTYIGHFPGRMSAEAHSYFRYNTHLALLLMLTLLLLARDIATERGWALRGAFGRAVPAALVAVAALCPLALASLLRFDLEVPQLRTWQLAALAKEGLGRENRLAVVLPGDNGSVTAMVEGLMRFVPPAYPDLDLRIVTSLAPDTLSRLMADGYRLAVISCSAAGSPGLPAGHAVLLRRGTSGWRTAAQESYAPPRAHRWAHVLSDAPLCL